MKRVDMEQHNCVIELRASIDALLRTQAAQAQETKEIKTLLQMKEQENADLKQRLNEKDEAIKGLNSRMSRLEGKIGKSEKKLEEWDKFYESGGRPKGNIWFTINNISRIKNNVSSTSDSIYVGNLPW